MLPRSAGRVPNVMVQCQGQCIKQCSNFIMFDVETIFTALNAYGDQAIGYAIQHSWCLS